jgi:hypothetical protein
MLHISTAISYNNERKYNQQAIGVIQLTVGASTTGHWDSQSVTAVCNWQKSKNGRIVVDGMVGPETLGYLIGELELSGRTPDASILRQFPHKLISLGGQSGALNPVVEFMQWTSLSPQFFWFKNFGTDWWRVEGSFKVSIKLNPLLSEAERVKYEYRQYIRGNAWLLPGQWADATKSSWTCTSITPVSINSKIAIPPSGTSPAGLTSQFKEDGMMPLVGTMPIRFGYRDTEQVLQEKFRSAWLPNGNGGTFTLQDTIGYAEEYTVDPKVHIEMYFRGVVWETKFDEDTDEVVLVREVAAKMWSIHFEQILR